MIKIFSLTSKPYHRSSVLIFSFLLVDLNPREGNQRGDKEGTE